MNEPPKILYHYCSNCAFYNIIAEKRIRLSLLSMSNDTKEGHHIVEVVERHLTDFTNRADALRQFESLLSIISAIGFCLSQKGDVLSQWRGYADNARGVAIGFDLASLREAIDKESGEDFQPSLVKVRYEDNDLVDDLKPRLQEIIDHYQSGKMRQPRQDTILTPLTEKEQKEDWERYHRAFEALGVMLVDVAMYAYSIKAPFFDEEEEWRIVSVHTISGGTLTLPDPQFQATPTILKPFRDFPQKGFPSSLIREIVVGPRNQTPVEVLRLFLDRHGFNETAITRSIGSYR